MLAWKQWAITLGAEFTKVYADKYGSQIVPDENAIPLTKEARLQQGIPQHEDLQVAAERKEHNDAKVQENPKKSTHPVVMLLGLLIGSYHGVTHLVGAKGKRRDRHN